VISVENVSKRYGPVLALAPITTQFEPSTTTVLIGPSGCGKSTFLRIVIGLITPDTGRVLVDGEEVTPANVVAVRRKIGYVIQDGGLFPHLSAAGNASLLARHVGRPEAEIDNRLRELAELVRLDQGVLSRYPAELSGGQRQRVGLMRALMLDPHVLLLDEPLGALDPITRRELQTELKQIFASLGKTVVMVTHDMGEAAFLGERIVLVRAGQVVQSGTLDDLLQRPADTYVTDFIRAQRSPIPDPERSELHLNPSLRGGAGVGPEVAPA